MKREVIYESDTARVVSVGNLVGAVTVTFYTLATDEQTLQNVIGFGEAALKKAGVPALHFINLQNHWWQIDDVNEIISVGRMALCNSTRKIGYGASMGAYAALRFSDSLALDEIVAFSPQYSIDSRKVPWESRWRAEAGRLSFDSESMKIREACVCHMIYDPEFPDAKHVAMIESENEGVHFRHYHAHGTGHFPIRQMQASGELWKVLSGFSSGCVDADAIRRGLSAIIPA